LLALRLQGNLVFGSSEIPAKQNHNGTYVSCHSVA